MEQPGPSLAFRSHLHPWVLWRTLKTLSRPLNCVCFSRACGLHLDWGWSPPASARIKAANGCPRCRRPCPGGSRPVSSGSRSCPAEGQVQPYILLLFPRCGPQAPRPGSPTEPPPELLELRPRDLHPVRSQPHTSCLPRAAPTPPLLRGPFLLPPSSFQPSPVRLIILPGPGLAPVSCDLLGHLKPHFPLHDCPCSGGRQGKCSPDPPTHSRFRGSPEELAGRAALSQSPL